MVIRITYATSESGEATASSFSFPVTTSSMDALSSSYSATPSCTCGVTFSSSVIDEVQEANSKVATTKQLKTFQTTLLFIFEFSRSILHTDSLVLCWETVNEKRKVSLVMSVSYGLLDI